MAKKLLISLSLLGMLLSVAQFLTLNDSSGRKIELSKKIGNEEDGENDNEGLDDGDMDELFNHSSNPLEVNAGQNSIKRHLTLFAEHKRLSIYFTIVTPPPES